MESQVAEKSRALLQFLKDSATLRRKRLAAYGANARLLWFYQTPRDRPEIRSAFFADNPAEFPDLWLEVRKKRMPARPPVPEVCKDWVPPQELDRVSQEPELRPEVTVLVERKVPDPDAALREHRTLTEKVPEVRRLEDHPEVRDAWLDYFVSQWRPWAQEMRRWQELQRVYEDVDFMRRRLEEAEEQYELILGVGLLVWRDPTGTTVRRHLLTAPAEISLDAAQGVLTVSPAASFDGFRIELDMLELQHQPRLDGAGLDDRLEELDVQAWDRAKVGEILRVIANKASPGAQVDEGSLQPPARADDTLRVLYAPALVLRERRPTAYDELISRFLEDSRDESFSLTPPWERFISEGEPSGGGAGTTPEDPEANSVLGDSRLYFPLPTNEEQRKIAERLRTRPYVLVKGPPGTGKSHTIANLICHLLASGERVLVTAHAPKALAVLRDLLPGEIRNLCVTALGSTRDDQRLLEDSVRGILSHKNQWRGSKWAQERIAALESELRQLEDRVAQVERNLRETREAETHLHSLYGGFQGTAAQIARTVEAKGEAYSWFPELPNDESRCPLDSAEITLLAEIHSQLTQEKLKELSFDIGDISLPSPEEFEAAMAELQAAELSAEAARKGMDLDQLGPLQPLTDEALSTAEAFLRELDEHAARARHALGEELTSKILGDLLVGYQENWSDLARDSTGLASSAQDALRRLGSARIEIYTQASNERLLAAARSRFSHFEQGGRRGIWFVAPRVVRETRWLEKDCRIDGEPPRQPEQLQTLIAFLELKQTVNKFQQIWPTPLPKLKHVDPERNVPYIKSLAQQLKSLLELFRKQVSDTLGFVPASAKVDLVPPSGRER